jgi:hypothetical protein
VKRVFVLGVLMSGLLVGGCAAIGPMSAPGDVKTLTGTWRGWIVTQRDFLPATLEIHSDGTFEMSGSRLTVVRSVTGTVVLRDREVRFEGSGGWRGTVSVAGTARHRTLKIDRDDRLYTARFAEVSL